VPLIYFLVFLDAWGGLIAFLLQFSIKLSSKWYMHIWQKWHTLKVCTCAVWLKLVHHPYLQLYKICLFSRSF